MSRPVIPPLPHPSPHNPAQQSEVLRRRLASAEEDARLILDQISKRTPPKHDHHLGSEGPDSAKQTQANPIHKSLDVAHLVRERHAFTHSDRERQETETQKESQQKRSVLGSENEYVEKLQQSAHPYDDLMVEPLLSTFSQDALISRVCRLESMLQTLKVGVAGATSGISSNSNGSKKQLKAELEDRVEQVKQELEGEVVHLRRQVTSIQEELILESEARQRLKAESDKLKEALEKATQERAEALVSVEQLSLTKQKLLLRLNELKEETAREASLRASLESSHSTLLSRINQTEVLVDKERKEVESISISTNSLRLEAAHLKEELASELSRRSMAEEACQRLIAEKEKAQADYQAAQSDCQLVAGELTHLQNQYSELIRQFEGTQAALDQQRIQIQTLEGDRERLRQIADRASQDQLRVQTLQRQLNEADEIHRNVKRDLEDKLLVLCSEVSEKNAQNSSFVNKIKSLQMDLESTRNSLASRERDFSSAASGLETELSNVRRQLQGLEAEKESVLKSKENLLEEVNQTVDSLMAERARLHSEIEKLRADSESLQARCRQVDSENRQLCEHIESYEQTQRTQQKVQTALHEMVEQKTKLAYENGKLQSQVSQLSQDLASAQAQCHELASLHKITDLAQNKIVQLQKDVSDFSATAQMLEGKLQQTTNLLQQRQLELQVSRARRDELEKELGSALRQVEALQSQEKNKSQQHIRNIEDAKSVNREISSTLEAVMHSHSQLQELVESLQGELGQRDMEITRLKNLRIKDQETSKVEMHRMQETLETLRCELKTEQDKSSKKTNRDVAELKKQNNNLSIRNGELAATNTELRQRVGEMEKVTAELQQKIASQKHKVDYMHKTKKLVEDNLQRMKQMREDIDELEKLRDEYMQKNKEQAETIAVFIQQITTLQAEVQELAEVQLNTGQLLRKKEEALEKERRIREELKKKYKESKKKEDHISRQKNVSDERLKEAHNESVEISRNLMEAHEWFKGKFQKLQEELTQSRMAQARLEEKTEAQKHQLMAEKSRAQQAAERAKEMIKASRHTISRLADYTEQADLNTKQQLAELRAQVTKKRAHAAEAEDKYNHLKDAILKFIPYS